MNGRTQTADALGATEMLREDHRRIKDLFRQFEEAGNDDRPEIADTIIQELEAHTAVEEEVFYPALAEVVKDETDVIEAQEAHHVARILANELKIVPYGEHFNAKMLLLAQNVRQHIKEEETVLLPEAERSELNLSKLGLEMARCKRDYLVGTIAGRSRAGALAVGAALAAAGGLLYRYLRRE